MTDTDIRLIYEKLNKFEAELKKLENEVKVLNAYVDIQLKDKYHPQPNQTVFATTGCLLCGKYDCPAAITNVPCPKGIPYALSSGSLVDSGITQQWRESLNSSQDVEE